MARSPEAASELFAAFDLAQALDRSAREAHLLDLADRNPTLAAKLKRMLARADVDTDMGDNAFGVAPAIGQLLEAGLEPEDADRLAGQSIGPFLLERLLGRGGMGDVWLAHREADGFRQDVALKLLRVGPHAAELKRRFAQERRILADLSHPGIARFIDGGVTADGTPWYAMEYVDGLPIGEYVQTQTPEVRQRVVLLAEVAEIVAHAQSRLVVHRDLKPSNILVDRDGRPRLLDFGIAKMLEGGLEPSETATGLRALSPAYAAPEQILGEPISTATDVYALGAVLYELLTGEIPHERAAVSLEQLAERVRTETIERPSTRVRRAVRSTVPSEGTLRQRARGRLSGELDTIVLKALNREPQRRYAGAGAFADDLKRWLADLPITARPDSVGYRIGKFVSRHRLSVIAASVSVLALVGGLGAALSQAALARAEAQLARKAEAEAESINRFFGSMLAASRADAQKDGPKLTVVDWIRASLPRVDAELADAPGARVRIRTELANALSSLGDNATAEPLLLQTVADSRAQLGDGQLTAEALIALGRVHFALGREADSQATIEAARRMLSALPDTEAVRLARVQSATTLLRLTSAKGDDQTALAIGRQNIADRTALFGADSYRLAVDYNNLSATLIRIGRIAEGEAAMRRARELLAKDPSLPLSRIAFVDYSLCSVLSNRGAFDEALALCESARERLATLHGPDSIEVADAELTEARVRFLAGDEGAARTLLARAYPRVRAAQRAPSLREAGILAARLAMRERNWPGVKREADSVLSLFSDGQRGQERKLLEVLVALADQTDDPSPPHLTMVATRAGSMLDDAHTAPVYAATAALAWSLALEAAGLADDAATVAERGRAALAKHMGAEQAAVVWQRLQPSPAGAQPESPSR